MDGLAGKARDRANEGLTLGGKGDTLSKCRTVRKIEFESLLAHFSISGHNLNQSHLPQPSME